MKAISSLRERDGHLVHGWYVACLGEELRDKKLLARTIYDTPLVLFRDSGGRARALLDRCLHRHAQLSKGAWLEEGQVGCPYHGWVYNGEGQVTCVPSEGPKACSQKAKLRSFPVVEQDRCVWVWMGDGEPATPAPTFRFPHFENKAWCSYFMITDFDNEVTHLAENFMDVPHTVFVHSKWFRNAATIKVPIRVETGKGQVLVTYEQPSDQIGFTGRILNPKNEPMTHTDLFIFPNITRVDYNFGAANAFIIISQITPVSTLKSRVYTAIIYRLGPFTHLMKPFFQFYTRRVIEQDVQIMANQSESFRRDFECRFQGTDADVVHVAIERLRELGAKGDPSVHAVTALEEKEIWI
jgi:phenylpropionate dioxygenase-like ring-hydroxylating dioxygenase large terminal subunit